MSRRFSDEPINLIHRIPTPEQLLEAARPSKRAWHRGNAKPSASGGGPSAIAISEPPSSMPYSR